MLRHSFFQRCCCQELLLCSDQNYFGWNICSLLSSKPGCRNEEWILFTGHSWFEWSPHWTHWLLMWIARKQQLVSCLCAQEGQKQWRSLKSAEFFNPGTGQGILVQPLDQRVVHQLSPKEGGRRRWCVSVVGVCATSPSMLPARPMESTAAWFVTEDPSCSFNESLKRSPSRMVTLALHTKQVSKKILKPINVTWLDLEQGIERDQHLSQGLLLPRSNEIACFRKLRKPFPDPVTELCPSCRSPLCWQQLLPSFCRRISSSFWRKSISGKQMVTGYVCLQREERTRNLTHLLGWEWRTDLGKVLLKVLPRNGKEVGDYLWTHLYILKEVSWPNVMDSFIILIFLCAIKGIN